MPSINVMINGKNYRMACEVGQEAHLENLAREFDGYVDQLKGQFGEIGDQRLTVMAGIMVTDEILELKKRMVILEEELLSLRETDQSQSRERQAGDDELASGLESLAKRLESLSSKLASPV